MIAARYIIFCLVVFVTLLGSVHCKDDSAENHVREFYQKYTSCKSGLSMYSNISRYVDVCALSAIRILNDKDYFEFEYFTKIQDCLDEGRDVLVVHKEMKINNTTSVVPVTFKFSEDKQHHLIVFVRKEMDGWRIIKVAGTEYFYE